MNRINGLFIHVMAVMAGLMLTTCMTSATIGKSSEAMRVQSAPAWVVDKNSVYPSDKFLAEIGEGDSLKGAKSNAAGAIAQIFRTQITVDNTIRTRYTEITDDDEGMLDLISQTDIDQKIEQSAKESLSNLMYGESWQNTMGRVYVIAYLDRTETGQLYRQRVIRNDDRVMELIDLSRSQKEGLHRYAYIDAALIMAEANAALVEQLQIINMPLSRSIIHPYDLGRLRTEKATQAATIRVVIEASGNDNVLVENLLADWATGKGFSVVPDGNMFLSAIINVEPVQLNNDYENLGWTLNLNLMDSQGMPAVTFPVQSRSSGISESAAQARMIQDVSGVIGKDFDRIFVQYLNSFLQK